MSREKITAAQGGGSAICAEAQSDTSVEIETVPPEPTARSLKEKITPVEHTPYADTKRPAVYDARCVGTAELRPCSPLDMIFRAHFSKGPGGLGSCVQLSANVAQCLRRANRFRTFKDCEAACKPFPSASPPVQASSNDASTSTDTVTPTTRNRRWRLCDVEVSFGPCSVADRRRTSANYVFERGRCVALRGSCTDAGFPTLRQCRSVCLGKDDPSHIDDLANSTPA
ncbi:uncharacterized protein LOC119374467 isoform X2 [Rhipicephalus sanguineus]|uniref:uncharacterized protein LOC119374467 isoform X2 n=1 Tax=Rhipicephalus sanguineus TaxID=34632 RepID=UPI0020C5527E|nr:uncharacterized protein LOC119374467 isoform X2 [Rhipicephalus sanguineus]